MKVLIISGFLGAGKTRIYQGDVSIKSGFRNTRERIDLLMLMKIF